MKSTGIVDRLNCFVNSLPTKSYDRPAKKFVREFLAGMMISKSTILTNIVRSLSTNKDDFKPNYKRINRRLGEVDLTAAYEEQQRRVFEEISDDTVIAIDPGEITKPYSKTLECLAKVADGSDDHRIKPGYSLLGAVAVNPKRLDKTPQPLVLELYSSESGDFVSENTMIKDFISEIHARTKGRGIHVIDRGGDRGILLKHYFELGQKFTIRLKDRYLVGEDGLTIPMGKRRQIERKDLEYSATIQRVSDPSDRKRKPMNLRFNFEKVSVSSFKKENINHECYLVTAWSEKAKRPIELLTSVPVLNSDQALDIVINYLSRWSVEETYRFLKAGCGLEEIRLFSFDKLKNLIRASFLAASLLARMCRHSSWQSLFSRTALRIKSAPSGLSNWLYRGSDACSVLLKKHLSKLLAANDTIFHTRKTKGFYEQYLFPLELSL
jgi:hypothetical protein